MGKDLPVQIGRVGNDVLVKPSGGRCRKENRGGCAEARQSRALRLDDRRRRPADVEE